MCEVIKVRLLDIYPCMSGAVRVQDLALHTVSDQKLKEDLGASYPLLPAMIFL